MYLHVNEHDYFMPAAWKYSKKVFLWFISSSNINTCFHAVYEFQEGLDLQVLVCLRFQALARTNHQLAYHLAGCFIYPIIFTARCIWFFTINAAGCTTFSKVLKFLYFAWCIGNKKSLQEIFLQNQVLLLSVIVLYFQGEVFNDFFISHEVALKLPLFVLNATCIGLGILPILVCQNYTIVEICIWKFHCIKTILER